MFGVGVGVVFGIGVCCWYLILFSTNARYAPVRLAQGTMSVEAMAPPLLIRLSVVCTFLCGRALSHEVQTALSPFMAAGHHWPKYPIETFKMDGGDAITVRVGRRSFVASAEESSVTLKPLDSQDASELKPAQTFIKTSGSATCMVITHDGVLAVGTAANKVDIFPTDTLLKGGEAKLSLKTSGRVKSLLQLSDGSLLAGTASRTELDVFAPDALLKGGEAYKKRTSQ